MVGSYLWLIYGGVSLDGDGWRMTGTGVPALGGLPALDALCLAGVPRVLPGGQTGGPGHHWPTRPGSLANTSRASLLLQV